MKFYEIYGLCWLFYFIGLGIIYNKQLLEKSKGLFFTIFLVAGMLFPSAAIYLTHDMAVVSYFKDKYSHENMVEIKETVEFPGSVYWEDNVFPGFDPLSRRWMVEHYLDGVHLQALALNGDDDKIYLYRATAEQFAESKSLQEQIDILKRQGNNVIKKGKKYTKSELVTLRSRRGALFEQVTALSEQRQVIHDRAVLAVMAQRDVFSRPADLPSLNYKVVFNQESLPAWLQDYIYSDKITIVDQQKGETIAWSKRYERYQYNLEPDLRGGQLLFGTIAGDGYVLGFDDKILFTFLPKPRSSVNRNDLRRKTYMRNLRRLYNGR